MPPKFNTPEDESFEPIEGENEESLEEQPAPRKAVSCWMAVTLIIIAACLLMRVFCFNLTVFDFRPIPLH